MNDDIAIDQTLSQVELAKSLRKHLLSEFGLRREERSVIGIGGESGSGKSVSAKRLAAELTGVGMPATVIHQDDYFHRPPRANHEYRCRDLGSVGPQEVDLDLLTSHVLAFRAGRGDVIAPLVDYASDSFLTQQHDFREAAVLIIEGTYVLTLGDIDVRIFLRATHEETRERRRIRNRDIDAPIVDSVLRIEHTVISPQMQMADILITASLLSKCARTPSDEFLPVRDICIENEGLYGWNGCGVHTKP